MMNARICTTVATLAAGVVLAGCENPTHTERDAAVGATAGAVLGGIIGADSGEAAEGAAIGAAAGGALGAVHGSRKDARERDSGHYSDDEYSDDYYRNLLTDEEVEILESRARASGERDYELTDFLTAAERENLRRRARRYDREIGS